jgi:hypothetical protein
VSKSPSPELESDGGPVSVDGGGDEERGGGKIASLIVIDIHNILMRRMAYFCNEEYLKRISGSPKMLEKQLMLQDGKLGTFDSGYLKARQ